MSQSVSDLEADIALEIETVSTSLTSIFGLVTEQVFLVNQLCQQIESNSGFLIQWNTLMKNGTKR